MQGAFPDDLAAMLGSAEARRQWVAAMYTNRLWGSRYAFDQADVDFMTEPFADEARLRAGSPRSSAPAPRGKHRRVCGLSISTPATSRFA